MYLQYRRLWRILHFDLNAVLAPGQTEMEGAAASGLTLKANFPPRER